MNDFSIAFFDYMQRGGDVLWGILALTIILWWLVLERAWYFFVDFRADRDERVAIWMGRPERSSWYASYQRVQLISEVECLLMKNMQAIPAFIALLPLMGLLGTVTGMIQVFDVMANLGSGKRLSAMFGASVSCPPRSWGLVASSRF